VDGHLSLMTRRIRAVVGWTTWCGWAVKGATSTALGFKISSRDTRSMFNYQTNHQSITHGAGKGGVGWFARHIELYFDFILEIIVNDY
jgi:hypothetical protein